MNNYSSKFKPPAPIGTITITNPNTQKSLDAQMIIDSGSDETCLPEGIIAQLGVGWLTSHKYVENFDGQIYSRTAFLADIGHYGNKLEKRFFITVPGEIGLLGRDIINLYNLQLNGIDLRWKYI